MLIPLDRVIAEIVRCERYLRNGRTLARNHLPPSASSHPELRETAEGYLETRVRGSYRARAFPADGSPRSTSHGARRSLTLPLGRIMLHGTSRLCSTAWRTSTRSLEHATRPQVGSLPIQDRIFLGRESLRELLVLYQSACVIPPAALNIYRRCVRRVQGGLNGRFEYT